MNDIECSSLIQSENENDESGKPLYKATFDRCRTFVCVCVKGSLLRLEFIVY